MTEDNREPHPDLPGEPAEQPTAPASAGPDSSIESGLSPEAEDGEPTPPHGIPAQAHEGSTPPAPQQGTTALPAEPGPQPTFAQLSGQPTYPQRSEWSAPGEQVVFGTAAPGLGTPPPPPPPQHQPPMPMRVGQHNPSPRVPEQQRRGGGALVTGVTVLALLVGGGAGALGGYLVAEQNQANEPGVQRTGRSTANR